MPETILTPDIATFIQKGVAIAASSRDASLRPSMARVLGCRVDPARLRITLLLDAKLNPRLLADALNSQVLAVVFCLPETERAIQIKGGDVQQAAALPGDAELAREHALHFAAQIVPKGFPAELAANYHPAATELVALSFRPSAIFEQTPGPRAGTCLQQ